MNATEKQSQFINVQCYAFSVSPLGDALRRSPQDSRQRQDEETILQNKANLIGVQMGANSFAGEDYENKSGCSLSIMCIRVSLHNSRTVASDPLLASTLARPKRNWHRHFSTVTRKYTFAV